MSEQFLFSDEAGDFEFEDKPNVSKNLIICTVLMPHVTVARDLIRLRHELVKEGVEVNEYFHATTDKQQVRDRVFETILQHPFAVQAQICEKAKAFHQVRQSRARFYKYPWFYLMKHGVAPHLQADMHMYATAASIGTKKERLTYVTDLKDVMAQCAGCSYSVDFRPSAADVNTGLI